MSLAVHVRYEVEAVDDGWLVWRTVDGRDTSALAIGRRTRTYATVEAAREAIWTQRQRDKAAASRLGIELVDEIHD